MEPRFEKFTFIVSMNACPPRLRSKHRISVDIDVDTEESDSTRRSANILTELGTKDRPTPQDMRNPGLLLEV